MAGLRISAGYIVAEQQIKTWTPIPYIIAMQILLRKVGVLIFTYFLRAAGRSLLISSSLKVISSIFFKALDAAL